MMSEKIYNFEKYFSGCDVMRTVPFTTGKYAQKLRNTIHKWMETESFERCNINVFVEHMIPIVETYLFTNCDEIFGDTPIIFEIHPIQHPLMRFWYSHCCNCCVRYRPFVDQHRWLHSGQIGIILYNKYRGRHPCVNITCFIAMAVYFIVITVLLAVNFSQFFLIFYLLIVAVLIIVGCCAVDIVKPNIGIIIDYQSNEKEMFLYVANPHDPDSFVRCLHLGDANGNLHISHKIETVDDPWDEGPPYERVVYTIGLKNTFWFSKTKTKGARNDPQVERFVASLTKWYKQVYFPALNEYNANNKSFVDSCNIRHSDENGFQDQHKQNRKQFDSLKYQPVPLSENEV